jgi:hypothetical protein
MKSRLLSLFALPLCGLTAALLAPSLSRSPVAAQPDKEEAAYVPVGKGTLSFNHDIAPIIYENCSPCHRPGEVAPFALLSYADTKKRAKQIAMVTQSRFMPPWKADEGKEKFVGAHRLSQSEIGLIGQWVSEGAPQGTTPAPPAPKFAPGWQNGEPDATFQPTESYQLAAEGDDVYRCFVIPTNYPEDRFVSAMEVRPGNRTVVHHIIAFLDTSGGARQRDEADAGPGYTSFGGIGVTPAGMLGGWVPGLTPHDAPAGTGMLLPKGADIVLQVHYHKTGKPESDLSKIGLYFAKTPVDKRIRTLMLLNPMLRIPAGEANYSTSATKTIPRDITVLSATPHMHWLGKDMNLSATLPGGEPKKIVHVNDWDFNWQMIYGLKEPMHLPSGTRIDLTARYDNSPDNLANPSSPPKTVTWGEQTTDEMCIAFLSYTVDSEHLLQGQAAQDVPNRAGAGKGMMQMALQMFDKNRDGQLDADERQTALAWWREHGGAK